MSKKDLKEIRKIENEIYELLKTVMDPEVELDIVNLGLVYNILYDGGEDVRIEMTLSTPACPLGDAITDNVKNTINKTFPDYKVDVDVVFDPPWDASLISEEGKMRLGM